MRRGWAIGAGLVGLGAILYYRGWSTQPLQLRDGRTFQVLNFDRHVSYAVAPDGHTSASRYFWVRYYSSTSDQAAMLAEARTIAPALWPIADSLGFQALVLQPSYPLLFRHFPLAVVSWTLRYEAAPGRGWHEVGS